MANINKKAVYEQQISLESLIQFSQAKVCQFIFVLLLLITNGLPVFSQISDENTQLLLTGKVLNQDDETPAVNAIVTNHRTKETAITDQEGLFKIHASTIDCLEISSLGLYMQTTPIPLDYSCSDILIIYARPCRFLLPDVNVSGNYKKPIIEVGRIEVSPYFRNDLMQEKPAEEKICQNQISFLKIPLPGKEQSRHKFKFLNNMQLFKAN